MHEKERTAPGVKDNFGEERTRRSKGERRDSMRGKGSLLGFAT